MDHDLGYKGFGEAPRDVRRRFSRLAGLLEVADEEFRSLRDKLKDYRREVQTLISEDRASDVELNMESVREYEGSSAYIAIEEQIANECGIPLGDRLRADSPLHPARLQHLGLRTIADVARSLADHRLDLVAFIREFSATLTSTSTVLIPGGRMVQSEKTMLGHGDCITFLAYVTCARRSGTLEAMVDLMASWGKVGHGFTLEVYATCRRAGIKPR